MNEVILKLLADNNIINDDTTLKELRVFETVANLVIVECITVGRRRLINSTRESDVIHNNAISCAMSDIDREFGE